MTKYSVLAYVKHMRAYVKHMLFTTTTPHALLGLSVFFCRAFIQNPYKKAKSKKTTKDKK